jgi:hypothetical protein
MAGMYAPRKGNWMDLMREKTLEDLFVEIEKTHEYVMADNPSAIDEFERQCGYELPQDLKDFYHRYKTVKLFVRGSEAVYRFVPVTEMRETGFDIYGDLVNPAEFLWPQAWFTICDVLDGNYIAIDLVSIKGDECNFIDCFHETFGVPGESRVIAKSFREFLEKSIKGGEELFFLKKDFTGYGDALEITPETTIFRCSNKHTPSESGWMVDFFKNHKSYRKYFRDGDYGSKVKAYIYAKKYVEENRK